jgi:dienelactone hydrolase
MKKKLLNKPVFAVLIAVLTAVLTAVILIPALYYHGADVTAKEAMVPDGNVTVTRTGYGWFFDGPSDEYLLAFYPGAGVEPAAYAPLLRLLAGEGVDVCLIRSPLRFAILDDDAAADALKLYSHPHKYVGGHSLGGAVAANFAAAHSDEVEGAILLAAYPTEQTDSGLILSIYGSEDGILSMDRVEDGRGLAGGDYVEHVISGGNHAQFGNYGKQRGDGEASVSAESQQKETAELIAQTLAG